MNPDRPKTVQLPSDMDPATALDVMDTDLRATLAKLEGHVRGNARGPRVAPMTARKKARLRVRASRRANR